MKVAANTRKVFHFVMIKPTHYGGDGYPIQWLRSAIPSNTMACLNGLVSDFRDRKGLGDDVDIRLHTFDETNCRIRPEKIIRMIKADGGRGLIAMVGVQSNQYPRAVDLARRFRESNMPVCIGGFHVSGCLSMLPEMPDDLKDAQALGISLFAGEAEEHRLDMVLRDAYRGEMKPLYNFMTDLPNLMGEPTPMLARDHVRRTLRSLSSFDLGRGCPFQCSFCTIINVQGRKSRYRTADDLEKIVRSNHAQGIDWFFVTDDNFARNKDWEPLFDRLIRLREEEGIECRLTIQVDVLCHRIPNFIDKAARAGVVRVFIGLENINPDNLAASKKRQNNITEYRRMLQMWKSKGIIIYAGYIIGFPNDRKETVLRDIEVIKKELPIDILDLFVLTPLPGSEDHQTLHKNGVWMDPDMNKYDTHHRVSHHQLMADQEWDEAYLEAWRRFYEPRHMETILRRVAAYGGDVDDTAFDLLWFFMMIRYEGVHPLDGGLFRIRHRRDRRPSFPAESPLAFYSRSIAGSLLSVARTGYWLAWFLNLARKVKREADRQADYTDLALAPVSDHELDELDLFNATRGGRSAVTKRRKASAIRVTAAAAPLH
jgi:tRNA A37 methylthiotransferase MiaB